MAKLMPLFVVTFVLFFLITNPVGAASLAGEFFSLVAKFYEAVIIFFDYLL